MSVKITHKDNGMKRIAQQMQILNRSFSMVGFPANGDMAEDGDMTVAGQATINEFGTEDIPKRPFMRMTNSDSDVTRDMKNLKRTIQRGIDSGRMSASRGMKILGEYYTGAIKKTIMTGKFTANASSTIAKKGDDKPLIDSRHMMRSVKHVEVIRK